MEIFFSDIFLIISLHAANFYMGATAPEKAPLIHLYGDIYTLYSDSIFVVLTIVR